MIEAPRARLGPIRGTEPSSVASDYAMNDLCKTDAFVHLWPTWQSASCPFLECADNLPGASIGE
jgi:hypothetical protein